MTNSPSEFSTNAWEITGYNGTIQIYRTLISATIITPEKLIDLLRALTAKYGLTDDELVACHLRRGTRTYLPLLETSKENNEALCSTTYMCGADPFFTARLLRTNRTDEA